jgi:uncharacterized membrane protein
MSDPMDIQNQKPTTQNRRRITILPKTKVGWWAIGLAVIGIASWVILPIITITFRDKYPVTDTWVMPAIGTVLIDLAAVFSLLCVWPWRERSVLNIVAAVLTITAALLLTIMVVGESIGSGI